MKNLLNETVETIMTIDEMGNVGIEKVTKEEELVYRTKQNFKNYYARMKHYYQMTRKHAQKILLQRNKYYIGRYVPSYWED